MEKLTYKTDGDMSEYFERLSDIIKKGKTQEEVVSMILNVVNAKKKLVKYKGGKCELCGYNRSINALHFHTRNKDGKDYIISGKTLSMDTLKKDVDKYVLVCSNCRVEINEGIVDISLES